MIQATILGVNQLALLRRCYLKESIGIQDVSIYYNIKINNENSKKLTAILEKLEIIGLLKQVNTHKWILTDFGKKLIEERFNLKKTG